MNQVYQWVDWFEELAHKIAANDHEYLVERAKNVEWFSPDYRWPDFRLFKYGDENVDPFSFIYTLASKTPTSPFKRVFEGVTEVFELTQKLEFDQSQDSFIFPTPPGIATLFHSGYQFNPQLLRELFVFAVRTPESIDESLFNSTLALKGVGTRNLTQALFLVSPRKFLPIDNNFSQVFGNRFSLPKQKFGFTWSLYKRILADVKDTFLCEFYEVNLWIYLTVSKNLVNDKSQYFQLTLDSSDDSQWLEWSNQSYVSFETPNKPFRDLESVKRGDILFVRQGVRKNKGMGIVLRNDDGGKYDSGRVLHLVWMNKRETVSDKEYSADGFSLDGNVEELFRNEDAYKLNFEILDRFFSTDDPNKRIDPVVEQNRDGKKQYPLNQIYFGPPGTGKTFSAEEVAVRIVDGDQNDLVDVRARYQKLCEEKRIEFVTFHQNYAYEDFIEGIRPRLDRANDGTTNIEYERKDGLFKRLCELALDNRDQDYVLIIDEINRGNISKIFGELITLIEDS